MRPMQGRHPIFPFTRCKRKMICDGIDRQGHLAQGVFK
jgi:hypothetical protein